MRGARPNDPPADPETMSKTGAHKLLPSRSLRRLSIFQPLDERTSNGGTYPTSKTAGVVGPVDCSSTKDLPELNITDEDDELLTLLLEEAGWGDESKGKGDDSIEMVPVEWVVDIADKDNDWFLATAYGYNDAKQTLYVMVPDRDAPTWTGDVAINPLAVRLLECCDRRSLALFKQLVRESALEVDWDILIRPEAHEFGKPIQRAQSEEDRNTTTSSITSYATFSRHQTSEGDGSCTAVPTTTNRESSTPPVPATTDTITSANDDGTENMTFAGDNLPSSSSLESTVPKVTAPGATDCNARVTILFPLGNLAVVELEGGSIHGIGGATLSAFAVDIKTGCMDSVGSGGDEDIAGVADTVEKSKAVRILLRLEEHVELVRCRGTGDRGEEAFYQVAEEGLVSYDPAKVNWRAFKKRMRLIRQDKHKRQGITPGSSSGIKELMAPAWQGDDSATLLEDVGAEIRGLTKRALELRDDLLAEHLATLRRVRRLVLDGNLDDGAALMEQAEEARAGALDERSARDREIITTDASTLESMIFAVAGRLKTSTTSKEAAPSPPPPENDQQNRRKQRKSSSPRTSGTKNHGDLGTETSTNDLAAGLVVTMSPVVRGPMSPRGQRVDNPARGY